MARVFITRAIPGDAADQLRAKGFDVETWPGELPPPPDELAAALARSDAALTMVVDRISPEMLDNAPRLRIVANMAVGYDNIDPTEAGERGIWVTNTPGVLAETTADFAWALLMAAARNVVQSERNTRSGGWKTWSPTGSLGADVHGATLGIVGLGEIGRAMARRAQGFGMKVLAATRTPRPAIETELGCHRVSLDQLLAEADFVTLHTPLTAETRRLIGKRELGLMKRSAILVNTARGGILDQDALVAALRDGQIAGAALDVTDPEPLPLDHALFGFENVLITPHIASASFATRSRMATMAAGNIIAVLEGRQPPNAVNQPRVAKRK